MSCNAMPPEVKAEVLKMAKQGYTYSEIAEKVGYAKSTIGRFARKNKIYRYTYKGYEKKPVEEQEGHKRVYAKPQRPKAHKVTYGGKRFTDLTEYYCPK